VTTCVFFWKQNRQRRTPSDCTLLNVKDLENRTCTYISTECRGLGFRDLQRNLHKQSDGAKQNPVVDAEGFHAQFL
jgi:hypothetical protein